MQNSNYMLAVFDENNDNKWFVLYKNFILQETKNKTVEGVFLRDMWFNTQIYCENKARKMHFMLIRSNKHKNYVLDDLNRLVSHIGTPSIDDKPYNTSEEAYYFELLEDDIVCLADFMKNNEKINSKKVILYCKDRQYSVSLSLYVHFIDDELYVTLPSFKID